LKTEHFLWDERDFPDKLSQVFLYEPSEGPSSKSFLFIVQNQ